MSRPSAGTILENIFGHQIAQALCKSASPESAARSALRVWSGRHPGQGQAPDGSPRAPLQAMLDRNGLGSAPELPPRLHKAVELLYEMAQRRADFAVRNALRKAEPSAFDKAWVHPGAGGPYGHYQGSSSNQTPHGTYEVKHGLEGAQLLYAPNGQQPVVIKTAGHPSALYDFAAKHNAMKSRSTGRPTAKAQPHEAERPLQGAPDQKNSPAPPAPPRKAPPAVLPPRPPKQQKTVSVSFTKAEAARSCRRCGLRAFEKGEFAGCLCHAELAKSAKTVVEGDVSKVSFPEELRGRVQRLAAELGKVVYE